jgi:hypothetical protein
MSAPSRRTLAALLFALAVIASISTGGCGNGGSSSTLLSRSSASTLRTNLNAVDQLVSDGNCQEASARAATLQQQVTSLHGVDEKLRRALTAGAARLTKLVQQQCQAPTTAVTTPAPAPPVQENTKKKENPGKGKAKGKNKHEVQNNQGNGNGNGGGQQDNGVTTGPDQGTGGTGTGTVGQPPAGVTP